MRDTGRTSIIRDAADGKLGCIAISFDQRTQLGGGAV